MNVSMNVVDSGLLNIYLYMYVHMYLYICSYTATGGAHRNYLCYYMRGKHLGGKTEAFQLSYILICSVKIMPVLHVLFKTGLVRKRELLYVVR